MFHKILNKLNESIEDFDFSSTKNEVTEKARVTGKYKVPKATYKPFHMLRDIIANNSEPKRVQGIKDKSFVMKIGSTFIYKMHKEVLKKQLNLYPFAKGQVS